ncbi:uncharacterized protein LAESUDRAFT_719199 [Laetiporus sulphureus 93-53]|uniref:Uncharacterized protein n=1 Tax=Laetiporus sulphureus 93-53 TaxID=1314785 RepID=A0A165ICK5_9APHY|nr:uncharacterized protein LAESUDRAFT_719199 [Laetiporus sulphureus 93-53]KZT12892.1 hypothetical protein LAESUDRAFT_719199 [Laetiporus sulphureus 93-53]
MRRSGAPRLHRLPQRLDYTLIPAPLDLSEPLVDEKAPLPAIIVTPSSPSHDGDFSIAFLMPPQKPTLAQRLANCLPTLPRLPSQIKLPVSPSSPDIEPSAYKSRARAMIVLLLLLFVMACHLVMHQIASGRPHIDFGLVANDEHISLGANQHTDLYSNPEDAHAAEDAAPPTIGGWFDLNALWAPTTNTKRSDFTVLDFDDGTS